jgi:hypothetical protein
MQAFKRGWSHNADCILPVRLWRAWKWRGMAVYVQKRRRRR